MLIARGCHSSLSPVNVAHRWLLQHIVVTSHFLLLSPDAIIHRWSLKLTAGRLSQLLLVTCQCSRSLYPVGVIGCCFRSPLPIAVTFFCCHLLLLLVAAVTE